MDQMNTKRMISHITVFFWGRGRGANGPMLRKNQLSFASNVTVCVSLELKTKIMIDVVDH